MVRASLRTRPAAGELRPSPLFSRARDAQALSYEIATPHPWRTTQVADHRRDTVRGTQGCYCVAITTPGASP